MMVLNHILKQTNICGLNPLLMSRLGTTNVQVYPPSLTLPMVVIRWPLEATD